MLGFCRRLVVFAIAVALAVFASAANAQVKGRFNANIPANADRPEGLPVNNRAAIVEHNSGSLNSPAYSSSAWLTPAEREREYRRQLMADRRNAEAARREASRKMIPARIFDDEDFAKSKYTVAHKFYLNGSIDAARKVLAKLIDDYPLTDTAERARATLTKF